MRLSRHDHYTTCTVPPLLYATQRARVVSASAAAGGAFLTLSLMLLRQLRRQRRAPRR